MNERIIIEGKGLKKTYTLSKKNIVHALSGTDITVREGDFTAIVGPSGCGKSTLLHILGLLDRPDEGRLVIDGIDVSQMNEKQATKLRSQKIGFVFQGFNLIPTLTALENVVLAARYGGQKAGERKKNAKAMLETLGLGDRLNHRPNELSGGQQQRVALARALINKPSLILADEPTGELDSATSAEIMDILKRLNREQRQTFVIVTHNTDVAEACASIIKLRDGKND